MKWQGRRESGNVEDRRGVGGGKIALGGGLGAIIIVIITLLMGGDMSSVLNNLLNQGSSTPTEMNSQQQAADDEMASFAKVVLADTEDVWNKLFSESKEKYIEPGMVLYRESTQTGGCGGGDARMGPFYCPADQKIYIDLAFFEELKTKFEAPGDFACAYVIAHEVGHHVQNLLGTSGQVDRMRSQLSEVEYNKLSVKLELQADFYAGIWAHYAQKMKDVIEGGDIEEALAAANAIGDDKLQKQSQGYIVPDAFTHGTSQQRMYWFKLGYTTGDLSKGDTFSSPDL